MRAAIILLTIINGAPLTWLFTYRHRQRRALVRETEDYLREMAEA